MQEISINIRPSPNNNEHQNPQDQSAVKNQQDFKQSSNNEDEKSSKQDYSHQERLHFFHEKISDFKNWLKASEYELNPFRSEDSTKEKLISFDNNIKEFKNLLKNCHYDYYSSRDFHIERSSATLEDVNLRLRQENDKQKQLNEHLKNENELFKVVNKKLELSEKESKKKIETLADYINEMEAERSKIDLLMKKLHETIRELQLENSAQNDVKVLKQALDEKTKALDLAKKKIHNFEKFDEIEKEANNWQNVQALKMENENLKQSTDYHMEQNKILSTKVQELKRVLNSHNSQNDEIEPLKQTFDSLKNPLILKENELMNMEAQLDHAQTELARYKADHEKLEKNFNRLKESHDKMEKNNQESRGEKEFIEKLQERLHQQEEELRDHLRDQFEINRLNDKNKKIEEKYNNLNKYWENKQIQLLSFNEFLKNKQFELENSLMETNKEIRVFKEKNQGLELELNQKNEEVEVLDKKYRFYKKKYKDEKKIRESDSESQSVSISEKKKKKK